MSSDNHCEDCRTPTPDVADTDFIKRLHRDAKTRVTAPEYVTLTLCTTCRNARIREYVRPVRHGV